MIKILAIDDNNSNLISLKAIIEEAFSRAILYIALDGSKGIRLAHKEKPDVILLDILMPEMDGYEVCKQLKSDENLRDIPVILLTALSGDKDIRIKALEIGAEAFLSKPIDKTELIAQIKAMIKIRIRNKQKQKRNDTLSRLVAKRTLELEQNQMEMIKLIEKLKEENAFRRKSEDALKESEMHFRILANSGQALIWTSDKNMKFNYFNRSWLTFTGKTSEHDLVKNWIEGVHPDDVALFNEIYTKAFCCQEKYSVEYRVRHVSGEYRWLQNDATPMYNSKDEFIGYIGHCLDINDRKLEEEEHKKNENKFKLMNDSSPLAIYFSIGAEHKAEYINPMFIKLFGYTIDDIPTATQWWPLAYPNEKYRNQVFLEWEKRAQQAIRSNSEIEPMETSVTCKDGSVKEIIWGFISNGYQNWSFGLDMTERKKMEIELRQTEEKLRAIFENNAAAIAIINADTTISMVNNAWCNLSGFTNEDILGTSWTKQIPVEDIARLKEYNRQRLLNLDNVPEKYEFSFFKKDGSKRFGLMSVSMIQGIQQIAASFTDITELKEKEDELRKSMEKFSKIFSLNPLAISINDLSDKNRYLDCNDTFELMTGYRREEIIGLTSDDIQLISNTEEQQGVLDEIKSTGKLKNFEHHYCNKNGEIKIGLLSMEPIELNGKPCAIFANQDISKHKLAEEALRDSEIKFRNLFEYAPIGIFHSDIDGTLLNANPAMAEILGFSSPDELISKTFDITTQIFVDPSFRPKLIEIISRQEGFLKAEVIWRKKDGSHITVDITKRKVLNSSGKIAYLEGIVEDITERKKTEEVIKDTNRKLAEAQRIAHIGSWEYILATGELNWSAEMYHIMGVELNTPLTITDFFCLFSSEERDRYQAIINGVNDLDKLYSLDYTIINPDGSESYFHDHGELIRDTQGNVISITGTTQNVTEHVLAEKEIKTLGKAIEQSPSMIIVTNAEGQITFVNSKFVSFMQYTLEEVINNYPQIFIKGHIKDEVYETMLKTIQNGDIWQGEVQNKKKDGTAFWENVTISPLLTDNGDISNYIFIMEDITEKKQMIDELIVAKEKAEESDSLKTAFLQNISHEIRTPMNAIIGFSGFLNDQDLLPDERTEFIDIIVQNCNQLLSIITDIVTIATIESGQEEIDESETNINSICEFIHNQFFTKSQEQEISFDYTPALDDVEAQIITDEIKLKQILTNLVSNAFKFTKKGSINFGYQIIDNNLEFWVKDTGIGISEYMQENIFKRFQQVENSSTREFGGSGLGLSISKAYVELFGGKIWLISELGKGSVFYFTIPYKKS